MDKLANKGTRMVIFWTAMAFVTMAYLVGVMFADIKGLPSFTQWFDTFTWSFGTYAASEVGGKGAEAYRDRSNIT